MAVDLDQHVWTPGDNLPGVVAVRVLVGINGGIAGDDTAAVEVLGNLPADEPGIFVRVAVLGTGHPGGTRRGVMGYTHDNVRTVTGFHHQE
jgi:hypothetical protein